MNGEFVNILLVLAFLVAATAGIALLVAWVLKRFAVQTHGIGATELITGVELQAARLNSIGTHRIETTIGRR